LVCTTYVDAFGHTHYTQVLATIPNDAIQKVRAVQNTTPLATSFTYDAKHTHAT